MVTESADFHMQKTELRLQVKDDVRQHQEHYSLLYVPHPFIIPGGRFREFYYWCFFTLLLLVDIEPENFTACSISLNSLIEIVSVNCKILVLVLSTLSLMIALFL